MSGKRYPECVLTGCDFNTEWQLNWFIEPPNEEIKTFAKIRYNSKGSNVTLYKEDENYKINFSEPQLAVTPGQSIVFYDDKKLIGGGIIEVKK